MYSDIWKMMGNKVLHVCNKPGCHRLTSERYCELHTQMMKDIRPSAHKRGYNKAWQKASKTFLANHPFCVECLKNGVHVPATVVDHIKPHKGNQRLFWDKNNWQPLCASCHSKKTVLEDGGFGNPLRKRRGD